MRSPEALSLAIKRLEMMRQERVMSATGPKAPGDSLVPLLTASAECVAIEAAIDALREQLRETAA